MVLKTTTAWAGRGGAVRPPTDARDLRGSESGCSNQTDIVFFHLGLDWQSSR